MEIIDLCYCVTFVVHKLDLTSPPTYDTYANNTSSTEEMHDINFVPFVIDSMKHILLPVVTVNDFIHKGVAYMDMIYKEAYQDPLLARDASVLRVCG